MREIRNLPTGIKIFTDFMSYSEAEYIIDIAESAIDKDCKLEWGIPSSHSPDISCFRNNSGFNISEHGFKNAQCSCGVKELDAILGKTMLKALSEYNKEYKTFFTQDEGFVILKQDSDHIDEIVVDENPFVNRILSFNLALNVDEPIEYISFNKFDLDVTISKPSLVLFPSNFIYSYSKPKNDGLYEVLNYFNNNPTQEIFDQVFAEAD
jgi:hypothetical protein